MKLLHCAFSYVVICGAVVSSRAEEDVNALGPHRVPQAWRAQPLRDGKRSSPLLRGETLLHDALGKINVGQVEEVLDGKALQVQVEWENINFPSGADWIGVFPCLVGESEMECTALNRYPVQFKEVAIARKTGTNSLSFRVLVRPGVYGYRFAYVSPAVLPYPEVEALSNIVRIPESLLLNALQVRLSLVAGDRSAMRFMWSVPPHPDGSADGDNYEVLVGEDQQHLESQGTAQRAYSYIKQDMCERSMMPAASIGWVPPGTHMETVVSGLPSNTTLFYTIKNLRSGTSLPVQSFKTAPEPNTPVKMVIFGDMGQSMDPVDGSKQHSWDFAGHGEISAPNSTLLVKHLVDKYGASLVNHIGDLSYATGALALWDTWLTQIEPVSSTVPYMVAIGNHEMGWRDSAVPGTDSQGECGRPYVTYFPFASQFYPMIFADKDRSAEVRRPQGYDAPWYSYNYGMAHITIMSTEHDFSPTSAQYEWIKQDLQSVNRSSTPWVLFMGHRPMYVSSSFDGDHDALSINLQTYIQPLLEHNSVDMAFWGHHHSYQRSVRIAGVHHFVVGAAGFAFSPVALEADPHFALVNNHTWGVSMLDIVNATSARLDFFDNSDKSLVDSSWVHRGAKPVRPISLETY